MLYFDHLKPSTDGEPLAVVRYRVKAVETLSAVGLVRCTRDAVSDTDALLVMASGHRFGAFYGISLSN